MSTHAVALEAFPALDDLGDVDKIRLARQVDDAGTCEATHGIANRIGGAGSNFRLLEAWVDEVAMWWSPVASATLAERAEQSGWAWDAGTRRWSREGHSIGARADQHRGNALRHKYALAVRCVECGGWTDEDYEGFGGDDQLETRAKRRERGECFSCNFWMNYVRAADKPRYVRAENFHGPGVGHWAIASPSGGMTGYGGRRFVIEWLDGRRPARTATRNLWHQGTVPERFVARLPINARFIPAAQESTR